MSELLRSARNGKSRKTGRSDKQNALGAAALRRWVVRQRWGRRQVSHFVGQAGSPTARQPRRGGVLWDIKGRKTSHFESFQSWTLRNVSHFESFEAWRPEKASHFESFQDWGPEKASHFESSGRWRLREVCHVSHFAGLGLYGLRPGVVRASGCAFAVPGLGHGASRSVGRWLDLGRAGTSVFDGTNMP